MSTQKTNSESDLVKADRLLSAIADLEQQVEQIRATGEIAPPACHVARYQVKRPHQSYWYYKLHASDPIFKRANRSRKLSKYKHLGKGGSAAHVEAVMQVTRRILIDELQQAIYTLQQVLVDLGNNSDSEEKSSASPK